MIRMEQHAIRYEIIDSSELARRWAVKPSWVKEHVRKRARDPIPHLKLGRLVRFEWKSPEMLSWLDRRRVERKP